MHMLRIQCNMHGYLNGFLTWDAHAKCFAKDTATVR